MTSPALAVPRGVRRLKYMYGAVTQIELKNFLDFVSVDTEPRKQEIKSAWSSAVAAFEDFRRTEAGLPDTIGGRELSADSRRRAADLRQDTAFANAFSNYPISFEEVEIDNLVASQRSVHVEYVDYLRESYTQRNSDPFDFCLALTHDTSPVSIGRTGPSAFTVSSDNPGLRFLGAFEEPYRAGMLQTETPGGQTVRVIALALGFGLGTANVYRVGRRMILNNGFHRLYTLRSLGVTHAPVVVQQVTHPEVGVATDNHGVA